MGGDVALARGISLFAKRERDVEEQGFDFGAVTAGDFEEGTAIAACQAGRVYISDEPLQLEALFQQIAHGGEHARVNGLIGFIVRQLEADRVARDRVRTEPGEMSRFT